MSRSTRAGHAPDAGTSDVTPVDRGAPPPSLLSRALLGLVRGYQVAISPLLGPRCRFYPSCSSYTVMAIRERGALTGVALGAYRILRCNPWARGGVDFPPRRGQRWPGRDGAVDRSTERPPHLHDQP